MGLSGPCGWAGVRITYQLPPFLEDCLITAGCLLWPTQRGLLLGLPLRSSATPAKPGDGDLTYLRFSLRVSLRVREARSRDSWALWRFSWSCLLRSANASFALSNSKLDVVLLGLLREWVESEPLVLPVWKGDTSTIGRLEGLLRPERLMVSWCGEHDSWWLSYNKQNLHLEQTKRPQHVFPSDLAVVYLGQITETQFCQVDLLRSFDQLVNLLLLIKELAFTLPFCVFQLLLESVRSQ